MSMQQVIATGRMPIETDLPPVPDSVNIAKMTTEEFWAKIQLGCEQAKKGQMREAKSFFAEFAKKHNIRRI